MFKKILIAYDGSDRSKHCLKTGVRLADDAGAELVALWVSKIPLNFNDQNAETESSKLSRQRFTEKLRAEIIEYNETYGKNIDFVSVTGSPAAEIVDYAKKNAFDTIIIGFRGHSDVWEDLPGHLAYKVSERANCNVFIIKNNS